MKKIGTNKNPQNAFIKFGQMGLRIITDRIGGGRPVTGEINIIVLDKREHEFPLTIKNAKDIVEIGLAVRNHIIAVSQETNSDTMGAEDMILDNLIKNS